MLRIFDGIGEQITSEQHTGGEISGAVRVIVDESADQKEVVTTLLRIAAWIEDKDNKRAEPWPIGGE